MLVVHAVAARFTMGKRNIWLSAMVRASACIALLAAATIVFWRLWITAPQPVVAQRSDERPRVLVVTARPRSVQRQWTGYGSAKALHAADVPARVTATVTERPDIIRPGHAVAKGELLVRLDESDFARQAEIISQNLEDLQAQLSRLDVDRRGWSDRARVIEEELQLACAEVDRAAQALAGDAAKQREVDLKRQVVLEIERSAIAARQELEAVPLRKASLDAQLAREEAALALARQNVERCRITAPLDGVIADVDVDTGESVVAGQRVARIVSTVRIEAPLMLPANARSTVRVGDSVRLFANSTDGNDEWSAQVTRISPVDDSETRTMSVYAEVMQDPSNPTARMLAPGTFVQGVVTAGDRQPRSVVPRRAISNQRLMLIEAGMIRTRRVEVDFHLQAHFEESGLQDSQWAVLREALPDDALVVVDGSRSLPEGVAVEALLPGGEDAAQVSTVMDASGGSP